MKQQHTLQPKLRFPEFEGDWNFKFISEILSIGSGKDYKHLNEGNIPVYGTGGLMTFVDNYIYDGDSVGIGRKGTIDKPVFLTGKFWTVDTLFYTHKFSNSLPKFVYNLFQKINWQLYNEASGVPSLSKATIEKIKINIPSLPEQQKIADYLTTIDTKINLLEEKKNQLLLYKKAMMQKLFAQEIRFKPSEAEALEAYPEWEEKRLGEISKITTGKLDANAMIPDGEYRFYTCAKEYYKIDKYAFDCEALLISGNGANVGYIHHYNGKFNAYQRTYVLTDLAQNFEFIKYQLDQFLHIRISREKKEGNTPYIVLSTLTEMLLKIPIKQEQQKIADFLSAIDASIEKVTEQISQTQSFKKAMLQQLFV